METCVNTLKKQSKKQYTGCLTIKIINLKQHKINAIINQPYDYVRNAKD